ncbi:unnamed protein product [Sphenostylis stenocarpa]|uniref:Uncharacterized protein n=1 Tax=Sphenostylis stenocarpa TaxID=92480 RepID=A0AA86SCX6_9FABA|nr:unnamed protein product [Sphenostylis stenocarpa]
MLITPSSMSYPDVVIACIKHKVSLEAFRAMEAASDVAGNLTAGSVSSARVPKKHRRE